MSAFVVEGSVEVQPFRCAASVRQGAPCQSFATWVYGRCVVLAIAKSPDAPARRAGWLGWGKGEDGEAVDGVKGGSGEAGQGGGGGVFLAGI